MIFATCIRQRFASLLLLASLILGSCGGGGGGGTDTTPTPPASNVARFAYTLNALNAADNSVSIYSVNAATGQLRHKSYFQISGVSTLSSITVDSSGKFAYVASEVPGSISSFNINETTGDLTPIASPLIVPGASIMSIHPSGKFAFALNKQGVASLAVLNLDSVNGNLSFSPVQDMATSPSPNALLIEPTGKFAYISDSSSRQISAYRINTSSGALKLSASVSLPSGLPVAMAIDSTGRFIYAVSTLDNKISAFSINSTDGSLTPINTLSTGADPISITIDTSGKFLYVANSGDNTVSIFTLDGTGTMSPSGSTPPDGTGTSSVNVDASGNFAYVTNSTEVSTYKINSVSGFLTKILSVRSRGGFLSPPNSMPVMAFVNGTSAVSYVPKFAFVANSGDNTISGYSVNPTTGALTTTGTAFSFNGIGTTPWNVGIHPSKNIAYIAMEGVNIVDTLGFDNNGNFSTLTPSGVGLNPTATAFEPSGRFSYVSNAGSNSVSRIILDPITGGISSVGAAIGVGANQQNPNFVAVDPTGRFLYTANFGTGFISVFSISSTTGVLSLTNEVGLPGRGFVSIAIEPSGKFLYGAALTSNEVQMFSIDSATGTLQIGPGIATNKPTSLSADPTGRFIYAANQAHNSVSAFKINPDGSLLPIGTEVPLPVGAAPYSVSVDPSGKFIYTANEGTNNVSILSIDEATGAVTLLSSIGAGVAPKSVAIAGSIQ